MVTQKYHKLISCMDVILDSYPFGGCNTTLDSFNFNKIVVTLPSDKINGRFTFGFYKKMDIIEPIANNIDDFVDKAINFASNKLLRDQIENKIKERKSLLFEEKDSIETWKNMLLSFINPNKSNNFNLFSQINF
jgi:predicted O-linked N-acetylglucosamine transferase (SPINDLY family)